MISKVQALKKFSLECILLNAAISLNHNEIIVISKNDTLINIEIGIEKANKGYFNKIKSDKLFFQKLIFYIKSNNIPCDRIIFRYPFSTLGLNLFTREFYKKVVFEHNTKEIEELKLSIQNKKYAPFSFIPSKFFYWYQEKIHPVYCEKHIAKKIFSKAHSGACVTSEIAVYENSRNRAYKTFVSSNFYNVSEVTISNSNYKEDEILTLGMIVTTTASWYGLERLFKSFAVVQDKFKLVIAGIDEDNTFITKVLKENNLEKNITFLGMINKQELITFYNSVHICFGSLGLYNINLNYASTLKVKESVSFGIPVVVAYNEEDFVNNVEFSNYYLQLENNSSLINFNEIKKFASAFYSNSQNKINLRGLAQKYLDVNVKMKNLLNNISTT